MCVCVRERDIVCVCVCGKEQMHARCGEYTISTSNPHAHTHTHARTHVNTHAHTHAHMYIAERLTDTHTQARATNTTRAMT
jgi:hypothetical protein